MDQSQARAGALALSALALVGVLRVDFLTVRESTAGFAGFSEAIRDFVRASATA
jgi:hypothetical protein